MNKSTSMLLLMTASITISSLLILHPAMAESEITIESDKTVFEPTARIFLTGTIDPGNEFYEPVSLVVYDTNGDVVVHAKSVVDDKQFSALITGPLGSFEEGVYGIEATHPSTNDSAEIVIEIKKSLDDYSALMHMTPLKQIELGTAPSQVICDFEDVLLQNNHRHSVACVDPSTAVALEERGWGEPF